MSAKWKVHAERWLMSADSPFVLPTGSLRLLSKDHACTHQDASPSDATFFRWLRELVEADKLVEVTKGVYLNRLGHRSQSAAAAASFIRRHAVVSLAFVLEQAGLTNNFGETFTCVIPTHPDWTAPQISDRRVPGVGTFRFHALRLERTEPSGAKHEDLFDLRFSYQRATPEKALLDWICLAGAPQSVLSDPPLDINADELGGRRLKRLSQAMGLETELAMWMERWHRYQHDPQVRDNASRFEIS